MILFYYYRYGLIWISTTLVFVLASLGNLATFLMQKHADSGTSWSFDVSYFNMAACSIYGYAIVVPVAYYFFLQYMGSNASLIRFWCMWGYSLTVFIISSVSFCLLIVFYYKILLHKSIFTHVQCGGCGPEPEGENWHGHTLPQQSEALLHHRSTSGSKPTSLIMQVPFKTKGQVVIRLQRMDQNPEFFFMFLFSIMMTMMINILLYEPWLDGYDFFLIYFVLS